MTIFSEPGRYNNGYLKGLMQTQEITTLIRAWGAGDRAACDALFPILYADLRRIAASHARNQGTLQATALVHESFLEFAKGAKSDWRLRIESRVLSGATSKFLAPLRRRSVICLY